MKTISKLFGVVAAIAALAACNKGIENIDTSKDPVAVGAMTLTVSNDSKTKVTMDDVLGDLSWAADDALAVQFDGDSHVYEFIMNELNPSGIAVFVNNEELPAGYKFENITDVYYPYTSENLSDYTACSDVQFQNNWVPKEGVFNLKEALKYKNSIMHNCTMYLHWEKNYGSNTGAITLYADRLAMFKAPKESLGFLTRPGQVEVRIGFGNTAGDNVWSDVLDYQVGSDLVFITDLRKCSETNSSKIFIYINDHVFHTEWEGDKYKTVYTSKPGKTNNRYKLYPIMYFFDPAGNPVSVSGVDKYTIWWEAINNHLVSSNRIGYDDFDPDSPLTFDGEVMYYEDHSATYFEDPVYQMDYKKFFQ